MRHRDYGDTDGRRFRFFQWNDLHVRDRSVPERTGGYPGCNEKAAWLGAVARGEAVGTAGDIEPADFVASVGDLICGETADYGDDFRYLERHVLTGIDVPVLPCVGNHENRQGEGVPQLNAAYDAFYGPGWHNYLYVAGGIAFIVVDTSGGHRPTDDITAARCAFVERALQQAGDLPVIVLSHVPLVPMRDIEALQASFGFSSWKVVDPGLFNIVSREAERIIAVLCGHIHITGTRVVDGVHHIMPAGTAGYPADFAAFDVFADRMEVSMQRPPADLIGDPSAGNIHGARRHGIDYTDTAHGTPEERRFTIALTGACRPDPASPITPQVWHETAAGHWHQA